MPYTSLSVVPAQVAKHKGVALTLAQANWVASIADGATDAESPWGVAWAQFDERYRIEGGRWVRRATEASEVTEPLVVFDDAEVRAVVPLEFAEGALTEPHSWHPIVPVGTWRHPKHGEVTITPEDVRELAEHFSAQIIGQQVPVDQGEGHAQERDGAFGWLDEVEVREGGLYGRLTWTSKGAEAVGDRRFKYLSPVIHTRDLPFTDAEGKPVANVVKAIALTNHPVFKGQPELTVNMSEYEAVADDDAEVAADPEAAPAPDPDTNGGDAMSEDITGVQEEEAPEAVTPEADAPAADDEALAASEETDATDADAEATTEEPDAGEQDTPTEEEATEEEPVPDETTPEEEQTVPMSELEAAKARIAALERNEAERDARDRFGALEFSEVTQGDKGRAIRRMSRLAPGAIDALTDLYLALPDDAMREKLVAFAEGENTRVPLGEWGPQDAVAFAETSGGTGGIARALDKLRADYPDDTIDGALAFAEAEGLTEAKDAPRAVTGYLRKRDNLQ
jgi:phage I-like protein